MRIVHWFVGRHGTWYIVVVAIQDPLESHVLLYVAITRAPQVAHFIICDKHLVHFYQHIVGIFKGILRGENVVFWFIKRTCQKPYFPAGLELHHPGFPILSYTKKLIYNGPPSEILTYYYNSTKEVPLKRASRTLFGRNCVFIFYFWWFFFEVHALSHLHLTLRKYPLVFLLRYFWLISSIIIRACRQSLTSMQTSLWKGISNLERGLDWV